MDPLVQVEQNSAESQTERLLSKIYMDEFPMVAEFLQLLLQGSSASLQLCFPRLVKVFDLFELLVECCEEGSFKWCQASKDFLER